MRLINDKGRFLGLVNPFDALVVLGILTVVFVIVWLVATRGEVAFPGVEKSTIQATFLFPNIRPETVEYLHIGDRVKNNESKADLGEIIEVDAKPALFDVETDDGRVKVAESSFFKDVYVTVEGDGVATDSMFTINGDIPSVGKNYVITTQWIQRTSVLFEITPDASAR